MYWEDEFRELRDVFNAFDFYLTPRDGYTLVETEEHKKARIEASLQENKRILAYHERKVSELSKAIEAEEKEILSLH